MTAAEVVVVGGGTAGAVVAARLAEAGADVLVLEAGPDPGPFGDPRWPADLLDASQLGTSYDWGFTGPGVGFERARVLGGCSAHNGAVQTWGHRADYDGWGLPGWSADELRPLFERASERQQVRTYAVEELTPFQAAWHAAGPAVGLPHLAHVNDLDETAGIAAERWTPDEQVMAKVASSLDPGVFDLHFMPFSPTEGGARRWCAGVAALLPRSRGRVTAPRGRVHGVEGLVVADASLMPVVPRATTHMPTTEEDRR